MWTTHYLDARGELTDVRAQIERGIESVASKVASLVPPTRIDIVVAAGPGVIPEIGMVGHVQYPGRMILTVDPGNPTLALHLGIPFERMVAHELHHVLRRDALAHERRRSLLESLVSEGLAGRFVHELYASEPEPWERALHADALKPFVPDALREADAPRYDHGDWFYGRGAKPRWLGYALGYRLVAAACEAMSRRPSQLAGAQPEEFRGALERLA